MLKLVNIKKDYIMGDLKVEALKGVSIEFRRNEFVSILGPSGCGKTTTLNIIGGLDRYTSGDLIIDNKTTKNYKDSDWDNYRNKKIGFVFQSYNLISHLSILANVEIALTIAGIKKAERKERAIKALQSVGLGDLLKKRPNQLSGGQMQRVAIARALVNDPEIILADEPTGALDSETSVQVMELLKEISKEKLIVMVTHNENLAKEYSSRIINILDGQITSDSNPYTSENTQLSTQQEENITDKKQTKTKKLKEKKSKMSFLTALVLSFKNLISKKGRTILTSFAGSIGIIGIALVLAISNGFTAYINNIQKDALSGYPVTISTAAMDYSAFTKSSTEEDEEEETANDESITVYESDFQQYIKYGHYNYISSELVKKIKDYQTIDSEKGENANINSIQYSYFTPMKIVVKDKNNEYLFNQTANTLSIMSGSSPNVFYESLEEDFVLSQYDVIYTSTDYDQTDKYGLTLVVSRDENKLTRTTLNALGFAIDMSEKSEYENVTFEEVCERELKMVFNDDYYTYDGTEFTATDTTSQTELENLYNNENLKTLKVTRIIRQKEDMDTELLSCGVMYSQALAEEYRENCKQSEIALKQAELKASQSESTAYTFYAPFELKIREMQLVNMTLPPFISTQTIIGFISKQFNLSLSKEEAYELAMQQIGISEIPQSVSVYSKNFETKQEIINLIDEYNKTQNESHQILYTDQSAFLTSTLGSIVNIISYVLIAFAGISLVVSSIMIGIITYVSVIERTKEIGILRSVGARKKDITRMFNSETFIIGLSAGLIGSIISFILTFPINAIVGSLASGLGVLATLKISQLAILTGISIVLSLISGLIPSFVAAKKDPVIALRTE